MDDLIDMMVSNESPSEISDKIKEILMQKSAENIDKLRPTVAASVFGVPQDSEETETEVEVETEEDSEEQSEEE
jgi:hypothetical protein